MHIRKSNDTLFYLIGIVPVVWLALLLAQSLGSGLPELLRNLTSVLEQPTNIVWTDKSLPTILICLTVYGMAVLLYRTNQGRTRDQRMLFAVVTLVHLADSKEELDSDTETLQSIARKL